MYMVALTKILATSVYLKHIRSVVLRNSTAHGELGSLFIFMFIELSEVGSIQIFIVFTEYSCDHY